MTARESTTNESANFEIRLLFTAVNSLDWGWDVPDVDRVRVTDSPTSLLNHSFDRKGDTLKPRFTAEYRPFPARKVF